MQYNRGMSLFKGLFLLVMLLSFKIVEAQGDLFRIKGGIGLATYYGDLKEKAKLIDQSSIAFNIGLTYDLTDQILARFDFSYLQLKADDRFNKRPDFITRNLNFRTNLWEVNFGIEYDFLNMKSEDYIISPYGFIGLGICRFNPWTFDRSGNKVYLREIGTEGQGLPSYPERKPYSLMNFQIPFGAGIKYAINEDINVFLDITFRKLFTDYLDDVGNTYPDRDIVLKESPIGQQTIQLTYRGDEVSNAPYPGVNVQRGGFTKDIFHTVGAGISVRLNNFSLGGSGGGGPKRIGRVGTSKSRMRNPGRVL